MRNVGITNKPSFLTKEKKAVANEPVS